MKGLILVGLVCLFVSPLNSATTSKPETTAPPSTTTKPPTTTTPPSTQKPTTGSTASTTTVSPAEQCAEANATCDACVKVGSMQCVWCASNNKCSLKKHVIPTDECSLSNAKWAVCWVNYEALIIACSALGGLLILGFVICICCCCCCKKKGGAKYAKEDAKFERQKVERKVKSDERRTERKAKTDEIRRKYGLVKDDTPYTRFDNN